MTPDQYACGLESAPRTILCGGQWQETQGAGVIDVISPADGQVFARLSAGTEADVDAAVGAARAAFTTGSWGRLTAAERGRLLQSLGRAIEADAERLSQLESRDTGKPLSQARADITITARYFEYYGAGADKLHGETIPFQNDHTVMTLREPHGVTGHVIPWNYPAQTFGRSLAPALAMGNATVLKPAEDACLLPLELADIAKAVGFPPGAINIVTGIGKVVGAALASHPGLDFLSFTGSPAVGTLVQKACADNHRGCVLELGGKSPQVVFEDADLDQVLPVVKKAIVQNAGQTCSAGSRLLVQQSIYAQFLERLIPDFATLITDHPERDAACGPLISKRQHQRVLRLLKLAEENGIAVLATGSVAADAPRDGYYVAPTLIGPVPTDHLLAQEEIFGPVLCVMPFEDEEDAVRIANGTDYGLVAGVWTRDGGRQLRMARRLQVGQVFVNGYGAGGGVELPFGGRRKSGHGREKGIEAMKEFSVVKTVVLYHGQ